MANRTGITVAGESNPGLVRKNNEDSFCLLALPDRSTVLAAVADGVGGHSNGTLASRICCRDLANAYRGIPDENLTPPGAAENFLRETLSDTNKKMFNRNYFEQHPRPMGTTVVAALFLSDAIVIGNAGDSRFYELEAGGRMIQHSTDHVLSPELAREYGWKIGHEFDYRNVISRAIGPRSELELELHRVSRKRGSRYLLCSDGAYRTITPARLAELIAAAAAPREAVNAVMREALLGGGRDNITVIAAFQQGS